MAKDFRAGQIRTTQLIASGSTVNKPSLLIASASSSGVDFDGSGIDDVDLLGNVGTDVFIFVSGSKNTREAVTLFGGDIVVSGTMYADRQVVEVDGSVTGSLLVSGSLIVSQSAVIYEGLVVNESGDSGAQCDFRVETDSNTQALYVDASSGNIEIDADGTLDIDAAEALAIDSATSISIGTNADKPIDIDSTTFDLDASGAITLDSSGGNTALRCVNGYYTAIENDDEDAFWYVAPKTSGLGDLIGGTNSNGTGDVDDAGQCAMQLIATAGGIWIDAGKAVGITGSKADSNAIQILADGSGGGIDMDAGTGGIAIDSTGIVSIDGADDMNFTVTSGAGGEDLTIQQIGGNDSSILITAAGTGADAVSIDVTAGSMVVAPSLVDNKTLTVGNTSSTYLLMSPDDTAGDEKILLSNEGGTATDAIKIHADAGGITLLADSTNAAAIDIDTGGGIDIDAAGAISLDSSAGSIDINVVDGQTVKLGLNGAVEQIIAPHGTAGSELYSVINTSGDTDGTDAAGAILLSSVAGGIGLAWADNMDLWAEGGRAVITANEDAADCIKLHADAAGTSQTITLVNDAGTAVSDSAAAVQLTSTVGAVTLNAGVANAAAVRLKAAHAAGGVDIDAGTGGITIDSTGAISLDGIGASQRYRC